MRLTNKHNLPSFLVRLIMDTDSRYSMGGSLYSITGLIDSPRVRVLRRTHEKDIEVDVSEEVWRLFGHLLHEVAAYKGDEMHIPEERLHTEMDSIPISGAIDVQVLEEREDGTMLVDVNDYKMTSVYSVLYGVKDEWIAQLNGYAMLLRRNKNYLINKLYICPFFRDWSKRQLEQNKEYPPAPCYRYEVPLWEPEEAERYFRERIAHHVETMRAHDWGEDVPECSDAERWTRDSAWAVYRNKNKRPTRVLESREEAQNYIVSKQAEDMEKPEKERATWRLEERVGMPVRCEQDWCRVSQWCDQWAADPRNPKNAKGKEGDE